MAKEEGDRTNEENGSGDREAPEDGRVPIRMTRRGYAVVGIILLVLVLLSGVWVLGAPVTPESEPVSPSERNTQLFYTLADASITDAVVDITDARALVRYNVPDNMTKNESIYYTLGATARVANSSERVVLEVFRENEPVERVEVQTEEILSYLRGENSLSDLKSEMERTEI